MRRMPRAAAVAGLTAAALIAPAGAAHAQADTTPPAIDVAVLDPPASHRLNGWYRAAPVTMNLRATDDVAVAQFEYSTDGGASYTTVPVAPGSPVTTSVAISNEGLGTNSIRYRARDTSGNVSTVPSTAGRTESIRIDTRPPTATFSQIVDGHVGHAATLTPSRADAPTPPSSSGNPGNVAVLDMWVDGELVYPLPVATSDLSLGLHTIRLKLGDPAGNAQLVTQTFIVTTSFADVDALLTRFETAGGVSADVAAALRAKLTEARDFADAGNAKRATQALNQFASIANDQIPPGSAARDTLVADARYLADQLNGRLPAEPDTGVELAAAEGPTLYPDPQLAPLPHNPEADFDVLVFSRTTGFRHDHIPHTILSIQQQGASENFNVDVYDPALPTVSLPTSPFLSLAELQKYETIVFESTVGHGPGPLNLDTERPNFEAYVRGGGGYVGIHGAADMASTMGSNPWNWYSNLVGGWFVNHPNGRSGFGHCGSCFHTEVVTEDHSHPATAHLPDKWPTVDELYNFDRPSATIRSDVHTLLSLTESSYRFGLNNNVSATTPLMGGDHPIAWCQNWEGGRAFSNILGHARWQYYTKQFTDTILGGIETTAGRKDANCSSYRETRLLIAGEAGAGLTQAAADSAGALLEQARTAYLAKEYATAIPALNAIVELSDDPAAGDAAARAELGRQARDLRVWMQDLNNG
jgi:type 1 glutamine amidotransferase